MDDSEIRTIIRSHYPAHEKILEIRSPSKASCDNFISIIMFESGRTIILRRPLKINSSMSPEQFHLNFDGTMPYYPMHRIGHQAWILDLLSKRTQFSPKLLELNSENNYLIESFIEGIGLDDDNYEQILNDDLCKQLGQYLNALHSIKMKNFGYMSEEKGVGVYSSWYQMFEPDFKLLNTKKPNFITDKQYEEMKEIYQSIKTYLVEFSNSSLLHGDFSSDNILVSENGKHVNGIIDYGDCLCGDGLYDIGHFLLFVQGKWKYLNALAEGYKQTKFWTKLEKECIRFYACYFALWKEVDTDIIEAILAPINERE